MFQGVKCEILIKCFICAWYVKRNSKWLSIVEVHIPVRIGFDKLPQSLVFTRERPGLPGIPDAHIWNQYFLSHIWSMCLVFPCSSFMSAPEWRNWLWYEHQFVWWAYYMCYFPLLHIYKEKNHSNLCTC